MRILFFLIFGITVLNSPARGDLPAIALKDAEGTEIRLDRQNAVQVINFWATWCAPCVHELPTLAALARKYRNNPKIQVVLVNQDLDFSQAQDFLQDLDFPDTALSLYDPRGQYFRAVKAQGLPLTLITDASGAIIQYTQGVQDWNTPEIHTLLERHAGKMPERSWWDRLFE